MAGLFDTFTISKRGLNVQQSNINTSAHNITNANTEGYSRQRSVIKTTRAFGGTNKWEMLAAGQVGTGAQVTAIQRVRNLFLDYQVRDKLTQTGTADLKYTYLYQAESILNDSSDTGIQNALNQFFNKFQELSKTPGSTSNRTNAVSQAQSLASMINSKYNQLETKKDQMQRVLINDVSEINGILDNINSLNKQIKSIAVVGMAPNDLMDQRDLLLDKLSSKFGIEVDRDKDETINLTMAELNYSQNTTVNGVNKTATKLVSSDPNDAYLRFAAITSVEQTNTSFPADVTVKYSSDGGKTTNTLTLTGVSEKELETIKEKRVLLTDQDGKINGTPTSFTDLQKVTFNGEKTVLRGELAGNMQAQEEIQARMNELDVLAATLAYTVNAIQTATTNQTGNTTTLTNTDGSQYNAELIFVVQNSDGTQGNDNKITAKNISVNQKIVDDKSKLICGENVADISGDKAGTRALAIANLATIKINLTGINADDPATYKDRKTFFDNCGAAFKTGTPNQDLTTDANGTTMKDYYTSLTGKLGTSIESVKSELTTCTEELQEYDEQRMSESGVSLDEEMTDMITFQHAYQANAKMINTIDQLLDVVINGLKA